MSHILDNKSDAEIEEIYSRATMEDLQSMLTQEKCLNRRRLLRKVMRCKSNNLSESSDLHKSEHKEKKIITEPQRNELIKRSDQSQSDPVKFDNEFIEKKLDEMRKELHETVDLTRRKELRKEIQELENSHGAQHKKIHVDSHNKKDDLSKEIHSNKEKKESLFHNTENAKLTPKDLSKKANDETETKFNIIKVTDSNLKVWNKEPLQTQTFNKEIPNEEKSNKISTISSNQNAFNKNLDKIHTKTLVKNDLELSHQGNDDRKAQQNMNTTKMCSSSQKEISEKTQPVQTISDSKVNIPATMLSLSEKKPQRKSPNVDSKPISRSNTTYSPSPKPNQNQSNPDSSTPAAKTYISRVSSVREKFENPPIITNTVKKPTSSKMTEREINDLVNAVLPPDKPDSIHNKLAVPNQPPRKISQPNIIAMIPQIKKVAKTARSTVQVKKEQLIIFCQQNTQEYQNVSITNYSKSWADGLAFCALIHHFYPDSFDYKTLSSKNPLANFTLAFDTAKKYAGIEPLIEPEDMIILESPDEKCVYTYVQFMYNALKSHPRNMVKYVTNSEG